MTYREPRRSRDKAERYYSLFEMTDSISQPLDSGDSVKPGADPQELNAGLEPAPAGGQPPPAGGPPGGAGAAPPAGPPPNDPQKKGSPFLDPGVLLTGIGMFLAGCVAFLHFQSDGERLSRNYEDLKRKADTTESTTESLVRQVGDLTGKIGGAEQELKEAKAAYEKAGTSFEQAVAKLGNVDTVVQGAKTTLDGYVETLKQKASSEILEQMPIGSIVMWPLSDRPPKKWRVCNGDPVTEQEAPEFCKRFEGSRWVTEKGLVVHVPDLRGYFIRGADDHKSNDPAKVDDDAPREVGSVQPEKLPQHTHDVSGLRVAGGLWYDNNRKMLLYEARAPEDLGGDLRTLWGGGGEWNTYQLHGGHTTVDPIALKGKLGPMIEQQGKLRPENVALAFIIRVEK